LTAGVEPLREALAAVARDLGAPDLEVQLERPREDAHGDLSSNLALQLAGRLGQKPRDVAREIVSRLALPPGVVEKTEIAGPGFINFFLADTALTAVLRAVLTAGDGYGRSRTGRGVAVNVEFVSANPTGPLHVGHGRGAALGDAIAALLEATGHDVTREFYVNDAGVQIERLARSLWARVQQRVGRAADVPEGGYHGEYLTELAAAILEREGRAFADLPEAEGLARCRAEALATQRAEQDRDLAEFGVRFDVLSSETALYTSDRLAETLDELAARGLTYERDGALWFGTSRFGDEKDRVVRKQDGSYTYFLPDIAYHRDKARRGFHRAIDVWGADHHGYVARMRAAMLGLGLAETFFTAVLVQLVRVMREGQEVRFSKRAGDFVTLRELYLETGVDAARYFFLSRRGDSHFVFDVDLAKQQSEENPVYYVQYAHTRMAGIFRNADLAPAAVGPDFADPAPLTADAELELMKQLGQYPEIVARAAAELEPHRVIAYLEELARAANAWYHHHRVLGEPAPIERARLMLARAVQIVLRNALTLLGITAPERM
jgi:arginyl-tRNA synthetase